MASEVSSQEGSLRDVVKVWLAYSIGASILAISAIILVWVVNEVISVVF